MLKFSLVQGRMRRPSIGARDLGKLSLDKGNKLKEVMEAYQGREDLCVFGKKREGRGE
jgi:hypothetical protein